MKLHDDQSDVGFYESFSDIIFATMAIFILLMTVFLVLAKETSAERKAQKKLKHLQEQVEMVTQDILAAQQVSKTMESELKQLSGRHVEIAIAVDKTGSMEQELYSLKNAIIQLSDILPKIMTSVRISIVAYRLSENDQDVTTLFPMTDILDPKNDGGASLQRLRTFMSRQNHKGGSAPVLEATQKALEQFSATAGQEIHQVFMLLGDVGPYELTFDYPDIYTPEGQQREQELVRTVKHWTHAQDNRNIIILFSGRDEINNFVNGHDRQEKHRRSMELFKTIAREAGQPDAYTENQSRMLVDFLVAALKRT